MLNHIKKAFFYSVDGLKTAFSEEVAFRIVLLQAIIIFILSFFINLSYAQKAILFLSLFICIIIELFNSSIENIVDLVSPDWHILAKKAKDMGSAAQFIATLSLYIQIVLIALN